MKITYQNTLFQEQNQLLQSFTPPNPAPIMSPQNSTLPYPTSPPLNYGSPNSPVYPGLAEYMGLELSEDVIRANMPEYLHENQSLVPRQSVSLNLDRVTKLY